MCVCVCVFVCVFVCVCVWKGPVCTLFTNINRQTLSIHLPVVCVTVDDVVYGVGKGLDQRTCR